MVPTVHSPSYRLWLHPLHGTTKTGLSPLRINELTTISDIRARFEILSEVAFAASDVADILTLNGHRGYEVSLCESGLFLANDIWQDWWIPLALSYIVESEEAFLNASKEFMSVVGVVAYAFPSSGKPPWLYSNARRSFDPEMTKTETWVFVVTAEHANGDIALQVAMGDLSARGAIRRDYGLYTHCDESLGAGSFGSVNLMRRPWKTSASADFLAAKHFNCKNDEDKNFAIDELCYLIALQGHPNIVNLIGSVHEDALVVIMEAASGGTIRTRVKKLGAFCTDEAFGIIDGTLQGLIFMHSCGILHRDIKPDNVCLDAQQVPILVDFGISAHVSETAKLAKRNGSPGCIAPEVLRGIMPTPKVDVFGIGVVLYAALFACMPFWGEGKKLTLLANYKAKVKFKADVSTHVKDCVKELLKRKPFSRPCSMGASRVVKFYRQLDRARELKVPEMVAPKMGMKLKEEEQAQTRSGSDEVERREPFGEQDEGAPTVEENSKYELSSAADHGHFPQKWHQWIRATCDASFTSEQVSSSDVSPRSPCPRTSRKGSAGKQGSTNHVRGNSTFFAGESSEDGKGPLPALRLQSSHVTHLNSEEVLQKLDEASTLRNLYFRSFAQDDL